MRQLKSYRKAKERDYYYLDYGEYFTEQGTKMCPCVTCISRQQIVEENIQLEQRLEVE